MNFALISSLTDIKDAIIPCIRELNEQANVILGTDKDLEADLYWVRNYLENALRLARDMIDREDE